MGQRSRKKDPTVSLNRDRDIGSAALCGGQTVETLLLPKDASMAGQVILLEGNPYSLSMLCFP